MTDIVNNMASICTWELEFYFRDSTQIREFVKLLMDDDIDFAFEYEKVLGEIGEQHYITIKGSWANNLVRVAKMADAVDYKSDNSEICEE